MKSPMPIINAPQTNPITSSKNEKSTNQIKFAKTETSEYTITEMDLLRRKQENLGKNGLKINRHYTKGNENDIYADIKFDKRTSKIVNPDGSVVFELKGVEVPETWSQVATDILAQKYLRKRGVPQFNADGTEKLSEDGKQELGAETSIKQVAHRMAGTWRWWGEKYGYFDSKEDAQAFEDEVKYMIVDQIAVPNSPQWFNTGLHWAYGITGEAQGHYYVDPDTGKLEQSKDAYSRPQPHACFIQEVKDDLVNPGGIFDLITKEARLFKYGSGTGTNFSKLRGKGEKLAGGGVSSGLMSFLKVLDAGAGAIQSGGTTRRAAKMVILDADHPEIETFINWKVREEQKVADLVVGSHINHDFLLRIMKSAEENGIDPDVNKELKALIREANSRFVPLNYVKRVLMLIENGFKSSSFDFDVFDTDFRSEAYYTVDGQNSNNSIRVTNAFMQAVNENSDWNLINRLDGGVNKTIKARALWDQVNFAAWGSADPGVQFHTTINEWHTCPADGDIIGSNPCSEYMFLDETACNLYQINMLKFYKTEDNFFDTEEFIHVVRLTTMILEISVLMSQLPSSTMAVGTYNYRTLGLGYANIGTLLMQMGLPYDSDEGAAVTGAVTAIMGGESYATSAEMANVLGTFKMYPHNREHMLRVIRNHRRAAYSASNEEYEGLTIAPKLFRSDLLADNLTNAAKSVWDYALSLGEEFGYRNAQVTCIAPTGTSGLVMDCDTTGIEPDFALVKFKKLVGGGYFKIINQSIRPALKNLGYPEDQIKAIIDYAVGSQSLENSPVVNTVSLKEKGFTDEKIATVEAILPSVFHLKYAFSKWTVGEDFCREILNISAEKLNDANFNLLNEIGFTDEEIEAANEVVCGVMTVEGAPYLQTQHYAVFDTANKNGEKGTRFIAYTGHLNQMAAAQPFISGAISKTINMPEEASIDDVADAYMKSWDLMLKATALYRDGSKLSQPLNSGSSSNSVYARLFDFSEDDESQPEIDIKEVQKTLYADAQRPYRRTLPDERQSITHKFSVGGHEGFITVGLYDDGKPGEIFITMSKEGSTLSGIINILSMMISINLQYGVPLETIVRKLTHVRFEPSGLTSNREIPMSKSIVDYIGRWLSLKFLDRERAKMYHDSDLVEKSYSDTGSNARINLTGFNGKISDNGTGSLIKFASPIVTSETNYRSMDPSQDKAASANFSQKESIVLDRPQESVKAESANVNTNADAKQGVSEDKSAASAIDLEAFAKMQQQMAMRENNEDAPLCSNCGSVTIRNGACYKCPDCGTTTGCS